jgi:Ni2+-binding GTPase involved in maturation of urease and hydrogenase
MDQEFLAALKLVSGEEILAVACHIVDEDGDYVIVENPIEVEEVTMGNKLGAKVSPWMRFSREDVFIIPKEKIITIVEVDADVQMFYAMSLRKLNADTVTKASGRISSVEEARNKLEDIFNS